MLASAKDIALDLSPRPDFTPREEDSSVSFSTAVTQSAIAAFRKDLTRSEEINLHDVYAEICDGISALTGERVQNPVFHADNAGVSPEMEAWGVAAPRNGFDVFDEDVRRLREKFPDLQVMSREEAVRKANQRAIDAHEVALSGDRSGWGAFLGDMAGTAGVVLSMDQPNVIATMLTAPLGGWGGVAGQSARWAAIRSALKVGSANAVASGAAETAIQYTGVVDYYKQLGLEPRPGYAIASASIGAFLFSAGIDLFGSGAGAMIRRMGRNSEIETGKKPTLDFETAYWSRGTAERGDPSAVPDRSASSPRLTENDASGNVAGQEGDAAAPAARDGSGQVEPSSGSVFAIPKRRKPGDFSAEEITALEMAGMPYALFKLHLEMFGDIILFRGTTPGWRGSSGLHSTGMAPATYDPFVAVIFGLEARRASRQNKAHLLLGESSRMGKFDLGNYFSLQEREVMMLIPPEEFALRARYRIPLEKAEKALRDMRFDVPRIVSDSTDRKNALMYHETMSPEQILEFINRVLGD